MELIDPRLLADGPAPALNTVAAPALPSRDKTARPVLQDARTLPSLWPQVKARGGRLGPQPRIEFEGCSFKLFARNDQEQEPEDNAEGPPDEADIDVQPEETRSVDPGTPYRYPSPPPRRHTYSARVVPEEEILECEAMED
jgi:hypothetical protein